MKSLLINGEPLNMVTCTSVVCTYMVCHLLLLFVVVWSFAHSDCNTERVAVEHGIHWLLCCVLYMWKKA